MIIAHPPCTYLSNAGARFLYPKGKLNKKRLQKGLEAKDFFMKLWTANCSKIAIENPIHSRVYELPEYTQTIQPYEYGHPYSKKTCLWLKGLPKLQPIEIIPKSERQSTKIADWYNKGGNDRQKNRSKTFPGIAKAMAEQWGKENIEMSILTDIRADMEGKRRKTEEEQKIKAELNKLFLLPAREGEPDLVKHILTRGGESVERKGLHASMVLEEEGIFCFRKCVLSYFYKQKQKEQTNIDLLRVFEEGNMVHEKWQRLFYRGGLTDIQSCDKTCDSKEYCVKYSPDIIAMIGDVKYVVEVKSMGSFAYKQLMAAQKNHAKAEKQIQLYLFLTGIKRGIILCENKDTQDFDISVVVYDPDIVAPYVDRMEDIMFYIDNLLQYKKMVKRRCDCRSIDGKMASVCPMCDVCFGKQDGIRI